MTAEIREFMITPADFGLDTYPVSAIQGGEPEENRAITAAILEGRGTRLTTPPLPPTWRRYC